MYLILSFTLSFVLSACTPTEDPSRTSKSKETVEDQLKNQPNEEAPQAVENSKETPKPLPPEKELEVFVEGMTDLRTASLKKSELGYSIYILSNFKLEAEEPGKDVLLSTFDDRFFVRIEPLDQNFKLDELKENTRLALKGIGEIHNLAPSTLFDPYFHTADLYMLASNSEMSVYFLVMKIEDIPYKFSFYLPSAEAAEGIVPSFWAMLKTITKN